MFQLTFEIFEQGKRIRGGARKTGQYLIVVEATDLACITLHDGFAQGYLAITTDNNLIAPSNRQDRGAVKWFQFELPNIQMGCDCTTMSCCCNSGLL